MRILRSRAVDIVKGEVGRARSAGLYGGGSRAMLAVVLRLVVLGKGAQREGELVVYRKIVVQKKGLDSRFHFIVRSIFFKWVGEGRRLRL